MGEPARKDNERRPPDIYESGAPRWMRQGLEARQPAQPAWNVGGAQKPGVLMRLAAHPRAAALVAVVVFALAGGLLLLWPDPAEVTLDSVRSAPAPVSVPGLSGEPVAAVARALLPSVVQIEAGGGVGSGVIYDEDGLVLTAAHVVRRAASGLTVRLADGRRIDGEVLGADERTDVAVVRVAADNLPAATFAVGVPLRVGQLAVAIGSPFGLEGSVTAGVVSAVDRSIPSGDGYSMSMIQTDAPINPGNSGGALADQSGRVIGINDAIRSSSGVNSGVGFAIPADIAASVADSLVRGREPRLGFLGIAGTEPTSGAAGALVIQVRPGGPAARAGLRAGDVITRFGSQAVEGMSELAALIRRTAPGTNRRLEVLRDGRKVEIDVEVGSA